MGKELEIEEDFSSFDKKMEIPQGFLEKKDWKAFKRFFQEDKSALLEPFDLVENTAIHIAAIINNPQLFKEFLEMLAPTERWHALRRKNLQNSTVLHLPNLSVGIAEIVLNYQKALPLPQDNEIDPKEMKEKELSLLEIRNLMGETPIYRAAIDGNVNLLKCLTKQVADLKMHFRRSRDKVPILHAAVVAHHFEVALWLLKLDETKSDGTLAYEKDDNEYTCLQLLCTMPTVFRSGTVWGTAQQFIYSYVLPEYGCNQENGNDDDSSEDFLPTREKLKGQNNIKQRISVLSNINIAIWKRLAKEWDGINHILESKKKNKLAEKLADLLVRKDNSWQKSCVHKQRPVKLSPAILGRNVSSETNMDREITKQTVRSLSHYTPLLLAAASGIVEIVEKLLDLNPQAINHVSDNELNILHVAVRHRQREIYRIIKKTDAWKWLRYRVSENGQSLLHQVGSMKFYAGRHEAGIAFQLQEELKWFHRVKEMLPSHLIIHCNDDNLTAEELFDLKHEHMLDESREWINDTAQSCSTVAVLVATVDFAAAYTIPGGTDERGLPIFLSSPIFIFFTVMDVVALASSLASVVMFLSILTSPFEMQNFRKSLPRKLSLGFALLLFSLITTMLAFSATILLTIRLEKSKWTSTLVYSAAFFPVLVFLLFQLPFYVAAKSISKQFLKKLVNVLPKSFRRFKSSERIHKRKYRKY